METLGIGVLRNSIPLSHLPHPSPLSASRVPLRRSMVLPCLSPLSLRSRREAFHALGKMSSRQQGRGAPSASLASSSSSPSSTTTTSTSSTPSSSTTTPTFSKRAPRKENAPGGDFYVDHTCIDCDTCRWMAPSVFSSINNMSAVHHQPTTPEERMQALQALLSCPTASIHTRTPPSDIKTAQHTFPLPISSDLPGIFHCGFHSEKSFGATSYLLLTPGCNVLIDSPRYTEVLASKMESMGGVDFIFLTHRDDVADHAKWAKRFNCPRILHSSEVSSGTKDVEIQLQGEGPWNLPGDFKHSTPQPSSATSSDAPHSTSTPGSAHSPGTSPAAVVLPEEENQDVPQLQIVYTPGHTPGCCSLVVPPSAAALPGAVFTGDHLALDEENTVSIFPRYNWDSVSLQEQSVRAMKDLPFLWVLPGHGRRFKFRDEQHRKDVLSGFGVA